ncbi:MAG: hypothetical protein WCV99_12405 [Sterolibacterium sp.]|jgi:hypothetical protein
MTDELKLYRAVSSARIMLRENREPAAAARLAAAAHHLGSMDESTIRRYAVVAELALQQWRAANPSKPASTTTKDDES